MKDVLAVVDQAHMATDDQAHAIHYATQAAKEYLAADRGSVWSAGGDASTTISNFAT